MSIPISDVVIHQVCDDPFQLREKNLMWSLTRQGIYVPPGFFWLTWNIEPGVQGVSKAQVIWRDKVGGFHHVAWLVWLWLSTPSDFRPNWRWDVSGYIFLGKAFLCEACTVVVAVCDEQGCVHAASHNKWKCKLFPPVVLSVDLILSVSKWP